MGPLVVRTRVRAAAMSLAAVAGAGRRRTVVFAALASAVTLTGCDSLERTTGRHRQAVEGKLAAIASLEPLVPRRRPDAPIRAGLDPAPHFGSDTSPTHNALAMLTTELANPPAGDWTQGQIYFDSACAFVAGQLVRHGRLPLGYRRTPEGMEKCYSAFERVRYVLALRPETLQLPQWRGDQTFQPGAFVADAWLFDLQDKSCVGGFSFSAASSSEVTASRSTAEAQVRRDLFWNATQALRKRIEADIPGARVGD